jgi:hypothetical protein
MTIRVVTNIVQHNWQDKPIGRVHAFMARKGAKVPSNTTAMCGFANGERHVFKATRQYITCKACIKAVDREFAKRPMTRAEMQVHADQHLVIAWPRIDGEKVTTNGYEEEALGLYEAVMGWCSEGYYVRVDRTMEQAQAVLDTVDWLRVVRVKVDFDIRMGNDSMMVSDHDVYFVSVARYQRLMRHCLKAVPLDKFEKEMHTAEALCKAANQKRTNVSGSISETSH